MDSFSWQREEHLILEENLKRFAVEVAPLEMELRWSNSKTFEIVNEIFSKIGDKRFLGVDMPVKYGGESLGAVGACIVANSMYLINPEIALTAIANMMYLRKVSFYGSAAQKKEYFSKLVNCEFASIQIDKLIEKSANGDTDYDTVFLANKTDNGYVMSSKKPVAVNDLNRNYFFIIAQTSEEPELVAGFNNLSAFIVERKYINLENNLLTIDNASIPEICRIGFEGEGWNIITSSLNYDKVLLCAGLQGWLTTLSKYSFPSNLRFIERMSDIPKSESTADEIDRMFSMIQNSIFYTSRTLDLGHGATIEQQHWKWFYDLFYKQMKNYSNAYPYVWEKISSMLTFPEGLKNEKGTIDQPLNIPTEEQSLLDGKILPSNAPLSGENLALNQQIASSYLTVEEDEVTDEDIAYARTQMRKIAQRLASTLSRNRRRSSRKLIIDFRRSMRRSVETGGVFINLKYKAKVIKKTRLIIILDTSGSMQIWIKLLIQLIQAIGMELSKKELFIFSQDLECVTDDLKRTWQETVGAMKGRKNWGGTTSIHNALQTIMKDHHDKFTQQAVIIMLSDLFTAEPEKSAEMVQKLSRKVKDFYIFRVVDEDQMGFYDTYVKPFNTVASDLFDVRDLGGMADAVRRVCIADH